MRKPIEEMTQKEFFTLMEIEIVQYINAELAVDKPNFYFIFSEKTDSSVEKYKKNLIQFLEKLRVFDFDVCPTNYVYTIVGAYNFMSVTFPDSKLNCYRFIQQRFNDYGRIIGDVMTNKDNAPLNHFNYLNLIESKIKFSELEKYIQEKCSQS